METRLQDRFPIERQVSVLHELNQLHDLGFNPLDLVEARYVAENVAQMHEHGITLIVPRLTSHQHVPGFVRTFEMLTLLIAGQTWHKPLQRTDIFNASITDRLASNNMNDAGKNELTVETLDVSHRCYESPGEDGLKTTGPSTATLMLLAYATAWPFEAPGIWLNGYRLRSIGESTWCTPAFVHRPDSQLLLRAYHHEEEPTLDDGPDRKSDTVKPWILPTYIDSPMRIARVG